MIYKNIFGIYTAVGRNLYPIAEVSKTRGHRSRVRTKRFRGHLRQILFTQKVDGIWNTMLKCGTSQIHHNIK